MNSRWIHICFWAFIFVVFAVLSFTDNLDHKINTNTIEQRLKSRILDYGDEFIEFVQSTKQVPEQSDLRCFVFKKDTLIRWSHSDVEFDKSAFDSIYLGQVITNKYGSMLVAFKFNEHPYQSFGLILLNREYPIENRYIKSNLNSSIFTNLTGEISQEGVYSIQTPFDTVIKADLQRIQKKNLSYFSLTSLALLVLGFLLLNEIKISEKLLIDITAKSIVLLGIRLAEIVILNTFYSSTDISANQAIYSASYINPTIFDILLNTITVGLLILFFNKNRREWIYALIKFFGPFSEYFFLILIVFGAWLLNQFYQNIVTNSFYNFSVENLLNIDLNFVIYHITLAIAGFLYLNTLFLYNYYLVTTNRRITQGFSIWPIVFVLVCIVAFGLFSFQSLDLIFYALFCVCLVSAVWIIRLRSIYLLDFRTYIFFILMIVICGIYFANKYQIMNESRQLLRQRALADRLLETNDPLGESLLDKLDKDLRNDPFINEKLSNPFGARQFIQNKIEKYYLHDYFNKYDVEVNVLNKLDLQFESSDTLLKLNFKGEKIPLKRTLYDNLYLVKNSSETPFVRYIKIIDLNDYKVKNANILIDLKLREILPNSLIPYLVLDEKYINDDMKGKSYAFFNKNEMVYSFGEFNYKNFRNELYQYRKRSDIYEKLIEKGDFYHFLYKQGDNITIISFRNDKISNLLANFGLHFLFLLFIFQIVTISFLFFRSYRNRYSGVSLTSKFQIIFSILIILPVIIIAVIMINYDRMSFEKDLWLKYYKKPDLIRSCLTDWSEANRFFELKENLRRCANINEVDINYYSLDGKLIATSQPLLYENNVLTNLINPEALEKLSEENSNSEFILSEQVGKLEYNTLYFPVYDGETEVGVISIPFYSSLNSIKSGMLSYLKRIITVVVMVIFFVIVVSYWASRFITKPLSLLANRLNRIGLDRNVPIEWKSNDELGNLIRQYNSMILKLEQSKRSLTKREKELAWKEMAKQVAHEIKNPLTPMKLSLQVLERDIEEKDKVRSLIAQVDKLTEIANSFSTFAKMPEAKLERVDMIQLLTEVVEVHKSSAKIELEVEKNVLSAVVECDPKLMSGVFTNLILNGIQAVDDMKEPSIKIGLTIKGSKAVIHVSDNGEGIPEDIRSKVFIPNFSTKYSGSGIGLALAKTTVEDANGRIYFKTKEGEGTTFFIELPLVIE